MPFTFTVPSEYGYVVLTATSACFLSTFHGFHSGSFRRVAKVPYPLQMATTEEADKDQAKFKFNCAQRAHANYLEQLPSFLLFTLVSGLRYPLLTTAVGSGWMIFRIVYAMGYVRPAWGANGRGRLKGSAFWLCQLALGIMSGLVGYKMLVE